VARRTAEPRRIWPGSSAARGLLGANARVAAIRRRTGSDSRATGSAAGELAGATDEAGAAATAVALGAAS